MASVYGVLRAGRGMSAAAAVQSPRSSAYRAGIAASAKAFAPGTFCMLAARSTAALAASSWPVCRYA